MKNFWQDKKTVILGASGFIGSHVAEALSAKGARVTAVIGSRSTRYTKRSEKINTIKANLLDYDSCEEIVKGNEIVFNFAAIDGGAAFKKKYPAEILSKNTKITLNILDASRKKSIQHVLLMSSIEVYSDKARSPIVEKYGMEGYPKEDTEGYAWSKRFLEIAARLYNREYGLPITVIRAGNIYGPGDYADSERGRVIPTFIQKINTNQTISILGDGLQKRSFLYIDDFVEAILLLMQKKEDVGPINIASEQYTSIKNLAKTIGSILGKKVKFDYIKTENRYKNRIIDIKKLQKLISFKEQTPLKEGLEKVIDSLRK